MTVSYATWGKDIFELLVGCAQSERDPGLSVDSTLIASSFVARHGTLQAMGVGLVADSHEETNDGVKYLAGSAADDIGPEIHLEAAGFLRNVSWRAHEFRPSERTAERPLTLATWDNSAQNALAAAVAEATDAGVTNAGIPHLAAGIIRSVAELPTASGKNDIQSPDRLLGALHLRSDWRTDSEPYTPFISLMQMVGGIPVSGKPWVRPIQWVSRRALSRGSRYRSVFLHVLEDEMMRQAVWTNSPSVTSAHAVIAIIAAAEQLKARRVSLTQKIAKLNPAGDLLAAQGHTARDFRRAIADTPSEVDLMPVNESTRPFWATGLPWGARIAAVIELAIASANDQGSPEVGTSHLIATILSDTTSDGFRLVQAVGLDPALLRAQLASGLH